ncbi:MAG: antibiotic biosynthesis monooxygenase family protein [Rhizobiaceae bacterium]
MTNVQQEHRNNASQAACLTLINVYEVEPEKQALLAKALSEATENSIRHQPGFISVCIHSSLDGQKVVNYAQWESKEHFESFMKRPGTQEQLKQFAGLAKSVAPGLYEVNAVLAE